MRRSTSTPLILVPLSRSRRSPTTTSSRPSASKTSIASVAATTATRRAAEKLEGVVVVRAEEDCGNPLLLFTSPLSMSPSLMHNRRRHCTSGVAVAVVVARCCRSWISAELDEVSRFNWLDATLSMC
ncbi:hypothetical protein LWI29_010231 [Acer saccharum]|uniref:Uncharacterized protein n=1 Tax=Acer saccharum TaxID=4024 RepID=A0AA39SDS2_ACESA|nr:hypothetical protein LWI29_010231 [Acer saccharum]